MSTFDIKDMGRRFIFAHEQHESYREVVALRFLETAVRIINNPAMRSRLLEDITAAYEIDMGMDRFDDQIIYLVQQIKAHMKRAGWDDRLKLKLHERKLGKSYYHVEVQMDLDATVRSQTRAAAKAAVKVKRDDDIMDLVSDNPSMDLINELDREVSRQSQRHTPLLSDRQSFFVGQGPRRR